MASDSDTFDLDLNPLLGIASNDELAPLVQYILKAEISESLTSHEDYKRHSPAHENYPDLIAHEIRAFGGNTLLNIFRDGGPSYREVVRDVADKLDANYEKNDSTEVIELSILMKMAAKSWEKMSPEERTTLLDQLGVDHKSGIPKAFPLIAIQAAIRASGFYAYQLSVIIANAIARALLGRGLTIAANTTLTRAIGVLAGPIGWVITGIWTLLDLAGPAYRVTIPCVVHVAMLRQQHSLNFCPACGAGASSAAKFCGECGSPMKK